MHLLALIAQDIGYWTDKLIMAGGITFCVVYLAIRSARRGHTTAERMNELDADRAADIHRAGPPRFNG
jgi:hypothetical protein